jgi:hypothetical protein
MMELTGSESLSNVLKDSNLGKNLGKYGINSSGYGKSRSEN